MNKIFSLKYKKDIDNLFSVGKSVNGGIILAKIIDTTSETKFLFAVSSKNFKRAVDRNYIKRLMRESVSKMKESFTNKHIAFIYINKDKIADCKDVNNSIESIALKTKIK